MGDIRVPRYATVQVPGDWPDMLVNQATSLPKTIFASIQNRRHYYSGRYFVGYQPAPKGEKDWANHDRWIGPFKSPEGRTITGIAGWGKNRLVLVTRGGMYIVQADEILRQAEAKGQACSTQQWRDRIGGRLEKTNWREAVIFYIGKQEWEKAAAVLSKVTDSKDQLHRMLWASYSLARQGKWLEAAEGYQKAIETAAAEKNHPAEAYAHTVRVVCFYRGERPKLARAALDVAVKRFSQLAPAKMDMLYKLEAQSRQQKEK